jgi:hypothetical protein
MRFDLLLTQRSAKSHSRRVGVAAERPTNVALRTTLPICNLYLVYEALAMARCLSIATSVEALSTRYREKTIVLIGQKIQ